MARCFQVVSLTVRCTLKASWCLGGWWGYGQPHTYNSKMFWNLLRHGPFCLLFGSFFLCFLFSLPVPLFIMGTSDKEGSAQVPVQLGKLLAKMRGKREITSHASFSTPAPSSLSILALFSTAINRERAHLSISFHPWPSGPQMVSGRKLPYLYQGLL